ncbi:hypothetical protein B0H10DRAFT_599685, partial [Mycena sp. CBHHK59/15]
MSGGNTSPYPSNQWNGVAQPHTSSMNGYAAPYPGQPPTPSYRPDAQNADMAYSPGGYYQAPAQYPASGSDTSPQSMYASGSGSGSRHPYQNPYPRPSLPPDAQASSQGYPQPYMHSPTSPAAPSSRPRSHSLYAPQQAAPMTPRPGLGGRPHPSLQYPQQVPLSQSPEYSEYPSSPARPFSCDMCALSFNRQHDLKRHRETHTGEKPYLC